MANTSPKGFSHFLGTLSGRTVAFIVFVTTLVGFVQLIAGSSKPVLLSLLVIGLGVVWLSLFYIFTKKDTHGSALLLYGTDSIAKPAYSGSARRFSLLGMVMLPVLTVAGLTIWKYSPPPKTAEILILVADFQGPESANYRVTENLLEQLQSATNKYSEVKVRSLGRAITVQEGSEVARTSGKEQGATMVLWGWYGKTTDKALITLHVELLSSPQYLGLRREKQLLTVPVAELESFNIQISLSKEMTYLTLLILGLVRFEARDYDGAIARLSDALNQPTYPSEIVSPHVLHFYRGLSFGLRADQGCSPKDYDSAINDFSQVIVYRPEDVGGYVNRGIGYTQQGKYDLALADLNKALDISPNDGSIYHSRGNAYATKGDYDHAIADFDRAVNLRPRVVTSFVSRGIVYTRKGEFNLALKDHSQAISLSPNDPSLYEHRGRTYMEKGDFDLALSDINRSISMESDNVEFYETRALIHLHKRSLDLAIKDVSHAISLKGNCARSARSYVARGMIYSVQRKYDEAIADFGNAVRIDPEIAIAYQKRADLYMKLGKLDAAIDDYNYAIKIDSTLFEALVNRGEAYYLRAVAVSLFEVADKLLQDSEKSGPSSESAPDNRTEGIEIPSGDVNKVTIEIGASNKTEDIKRAIQDFQSAIRIKQDGGVYHKLGVAYSLAADKQNAMLSLNKGLELTTDQGIRKQIEDELQKLK